MENALQVSKQLSKKLSEFKAHAEQLEKRMSLEDKIYWDSIVKLRQAGFKVKLDKLPIAGESHLFSVKQIQSKTTAGSAGSAAALNDTSWNFVYKHYLPSSGVLVTISKEISAETTLQLPGYSQSNATVDATGNFTLRGLETQADIGIILHGTGLISKIHTTARIRVFCKKPFEVRDQIQATAGFYANALKLKNLGRIDGSIINVRTLAGIAKEISLDNRKGQMKAGRLIIRARTVDNRNGIMEANTTFIKAYGKFYNASGYVHSIRGGKLIVTEKILNQTGRITTKQGLLKVKSKNSSIETTENGCIHALEGKLLIKANKIVTSDSSLIHGEVETKLIGERVNQESILGGGKVEVVTRQWMDIGSVVSYGTLNLTAHNQKRLVFRKSFASKDETTIQTNEACFNQWVRASTLNLYVDVPWYPNASNPILTNCLKFYLKDGIELTRPVALPCTLQFILRQGAIKPIYLFNDVMLGTTSQKSNDKVDYKNTVDNKVKKEDSKIKAENEINKIEAAVNNTGSAANNVAIAVKKVAMLDKPADFIIDSEGQDLQLAYEAELPEKLELKHTPALILNKKGILEFLIYNKTEVKRLQPTAALEMPAKELEEFFQRNKSLKQIFLLREHPIIRFITQQGKHRNKHVVPVFIDPREKLYIKVTATGMVDIHSAQFDLLKGKVIGMQGLSIISASGDLLLGRLKKLEENKDMPCGLISKAEVALESEQKIISEGTEIHGEAGLRFVSPYIFENISGKITTGGDALIDAPLFNHKILTGYKPPVKEFVRFDYVFGNVPLYKVLTEGSENALAPPAYMHVGKTLTTTGKTENCGSIIHHGNFVGLAPNLIEFQSRTENCPLKMRRAHLGGRSMGKYTYGIPIIPKFSAASKELVLASPNFDLVGIVYAPSIKLINIKRGSVGLTAKYILLPPAPKFVPVSSLMDNLYQSPRFEYSGLHSETVYRDVLNISSKTFFPRTILNIDGSLSANSHNMGRILPTAWEAELLVAKLLKDFGRGILNPEIVQPEEILNKLLQEAFALQRSGIAVKGLDKENNPVWCADIKEPILVYKELVFEGIPKLAPYVIFPPSWNNIKLRDYAGGLFAFKDIIFQGESRDNSTAVITAHLVAGGTIEFRDLKKLSYEQHVYEKQVQVTDITSSTSWFGLSEKTDVQTRTVTLCTPNAGNTVTADKMVFQNIVEIAKQGGQWTIGKGGIVGTEIGKLNYTPVIQTTLQTHHTASGNDWGSVSALQHIEKHTIHPPRMNSEGIIHLETIEQSHGSTKMKAKLDIKLLAKEQVKFQAPKLNEVLPAVASSHRLIQKLTTGSAEKAETCSLHSEQG